LTESAVEQIDTAATQLRVQADTLRQLTRHIDTLINEASHHWQGRDIQAFNGQWQLQLRGRLVDSASRIETMSNQLRSQADAQRATSAAGEETITTAQNPILPSTAFGIPTTLTAPSTAIFSPLLVPTGPSLNPVLKDMLNRMSPDDIASSDSAISPADKSTRQEDDHKPTAPCFSDGLGSPTDGDQKVMPLVPDWPAKDGPLNDGFNTKSPTDETYWSEAGKWWQARGAGFLGMGDAADNLLHYLDGSGTDQPLDVDGMMAVPEFQQGVSDRREALAQSAIERALADGATGPITYPISTPWEGFYFQEGYSKNWYFAAGGVQVSQQGSVTVYPPGTSSGETGPDATSWQAEVSTKVSIYDADNWDAGKSTELPSGETTTDEQMRELMLVGQAKEFNMYGSSSRNSESFTVEP
jgi:uncharacterized protein YukE